MFAINEACDEHAPEWDALFVEALMDYVVHQEVPQGYVSEKNANWLMHAISRDGIVCSRTELELLIKVIEVANSAPPQLSAFALAQVAHTAVEGDGPLAQGRTAKPGVVTADDVQMLRRILYGFGGDGHIGITREEAEVLFDINDRTIEAENHPSWSDLFTKAIGFSLMAATHAVRVDREAALRRREWLNDTSVDVAGFFAGMFAGSLRDYRDALATETGVEQAFATRNAAFEASNQAAQVICAEEADWIAQRIGRDGVLHANEKDLLLFLKAESKQIHPKLEPLMDQVA